MDSNLAHPATNTEVLGLLCYISVLSFSVHTYERGKLLNKGKELAAIPLTERRARVERLALLTSAWSMGWLLAYQIARFAVADNASWVTSFYADKPIPEFPQLLLCTSFINSMLMGSFTLVFSLRARSMRSIAFLSGAALSFAYILFQMLAPLILAPSYWQRP